MTLSASVAPSWADVSAGHTRAGSVLRFAIPAATLGVELARGEWQGAWWYAQELGTATAATEVLKRTTHVERPDRTNDQSFPSGNATLAFSAASYAHRRYGPREAAPLYALATYVGYTRVQAGRHRWGDIAGSLAVTSAASWWLVEPKDGSAVALLPQPGHRSVAIAVAVTW